MDVSKPLVESLRALVAAETRLGRAKLGYEGGEWEVDGKTYLEAVETARKAFSEERAKFVLLLIRA